MKSDEACQAVIPIPIFTPYSSRHTPCAVTIATIRRKVVGIRRKVVGIRRMRNLVYTRRVP